MEKEQKIARLKKQYKEVFDDLSKWEKEVEENNNNILKELSREFGDSIHEDFRHCVEDCIMSAKLEIVSEPNGHPQKGESYGFLKTIWVDQWSVGNTGDSFSGFIYGQLDEKRWLKIPYDC